MTDPVVVPSSPTSDDLSRQGNAPERVSDIALATAVARATRDVPGVMDLSAGRFALAATYGGSGQRVTGVVVRHPTPSTIALEIHVILSQAPREQSPGAEAAPAHAGQDADEHGSLTSIADQIRAVAFRTAEAMSASHLMAVDVLIDDLR